MIIEGIIQGLTEFLPISSSGHLVLIQSLFGGGSIASVVLLHLGTLIAVLFFFRIDILQIITGVFKGINDPNTHLLLLLIIATIPAVIIGVLLEHNIEQAFLSYRLTFILLVFNGLFIFGTKFASNHDRDFTVIDAILIGTYQAMAIFPGISRSGATIAIAIYLGIKPIKAFRFSFLLSIPAIIGAGVFEFEGLSGSFSTAWPGLITSFLSGILALFILRKLVLLKLFHLFGIYCVAIGLVGIIFF